MRFKFILLKMCKSHTIAGSECMTWKNVEVTININIFGSVANYLVFAIFRCCFALENNLRKCLNLQNIIYDE
jgi:hypothetical protein